MGRGTREEAIRELGVEVTANDQQMEHDLAQYIAGIMEYPKTGSPEHEIGYLAELISVGMGINWDALTSGRRTNGFGGSPYNGGTNNAMSPGGDGIGANGRRGAGSRDGVRGG